MRLATTRARLVAAVPLLTCQIRAAKSTVKPPSLTAPAQPYPHVSQAFSAADSTRRSRRAVDFDGGPFSTIPDTPLLRSSSFLRAIRPSRPPDLTGKAGRTMTPHDIVHADQARKETPFLNTTDAGAYVGLSRRTLEKMRTSGNGPTYRKHGRYVRYHIADLDAWSTSRSKNSTSEGGADAPPLSRDRPAIRDVRRPSIVPKGETRRHA
jgi:predicted DNA-binding transcriptional regulator AlpA